MVGGQARLVLGGDPVQACRRASMCPHEALLFLLRMPEVNTFPEDLRLSPTRAPRCKPQISFPCKHPAPQTCLCQLLQSEKR